MMEVMTEHPSCVCGSHVFSVSATFIECKGCKRTWGRLNDRWVLVGVSDDHAAGTRDTSLVCEGRFEDTETL